MVGSRRLQVVLLGAFLAMVVPEHALAHKTSLTTAEVSVSGKEVTCRLKVSAHDLAVALGIETDLVTPVSMAAFEERTEVLSRYIRDRLAIQAQNAPVPSQPPVVDYTLLPDDLLLVVDFNCSEPVEQLAVNYLLFFDIDSSHRSLGRLILPGSEEQFLFDRYCHSRIHNLTDLLKE